jgi:hypothetical protein
MLTMMKPVDYLRDTAVISLIFPTRLWSIVYRKGEFMFDTDFLFGLQERTHRPQ